MHCLRHHRLPVQVHVIHINIIISLFYLHCLMFTPDKREELLDKDSHLSVSASISVLMMSCKSWRENTFERHSDQFVIDAFIVSWESRVILQQNWETFFTDADLRKVTSFHISWLTSMMVNVISLPVVLYGLLHGILHGISLTRRLQSWRESPWLLW